MKDAFLGKNLLRYQFVMKKFSIANHFTIMTWQSISDGKNYESMREYEKNYGFTMSEL